MAGDAGGGGWTSPAGLPPSSPGVAEVELLRKSELLRRATGTMADALQAHRRTEAQLSALLDEISDESSARVAAVRRTQARLGAK